MIKFRVRFISKITYKKTKVFYNKMTTTGKVIQCRAALLKGVNQPYVIDTVEVAPPKKDEVRIKMTSTGVCHSDLHFVEGADPNLPFPCILGHEGAGIIESVGEGVTSVAPGDLVVLVFESYCGECDYCKNPKTVLCQKQPRNFKQMDGTSRVTYQGKPVPTLASLGTFCEYVTTSVFNVTKVNPKAPANKLALAGCCIPTGYGAAMNAGKVNPGSTCAVWGLGGVGMCIVMGCRDSGASKIIGIDTNPQKFALAKELGCTDVINPKDIKGSLQEELAQMTNGGVDYCFVSVGIIPVMEEAFRCCHPAWGKTVIVGITDLGATMKAGIWELLYGRQLVGTFYGSYKARLAIPSLVDKIINGQLQLDKLISHLLPLDKLNEGYELLKQGKSLRTVIDFNLKA